MTTFRRWGWIVGLAALAAMASPAGRAGATPATPATSATPAGAPAVAVGTHEVVLVIELVPEEPIPPGDTVEVRVRSWSTGQRWEWRFAFAPELRLQPIALADSVEYEVRAYTRHGLMGHVELKWTTAAMDSIDSGELRLRMLLGRPLESAAPAPPEEPDIRFQRVFFATNRAPVPEATEFGERFGTERSEALAYGDAIVSFPPGHEVGHIERPAWWRLEFDESPERHVMIRQLRERRQDDFFATLEDEAGHWAEPQLLIFVHGYNVTFNDAMLRTAQLAYDLRYQGAPLLFTWPSQGKLSGYLADEATAEWSVAAFEGLLDSLAHRTNLRSIEIVAHSMGNRIVTAALAHLRERARVPGTAPIRELVLAAPDIDAGTFRQLQQRLRGAADRTTLYGSSRDKAIEASRQVHHAPRAGSGGDAIMVVDGIETVDASDVKTDFIDHGYVGDSETVITDLDAVLKGRPPGERCCLQPRTKQGLRYWRIQP